jgi:hypothetical protein
MATHATAFENPMLLVERVILSAFARPDDVCQVLFPMYPFDGEKIMIKDWIAKIRAYGPLAPQAVLEEYQMAQRAAEFDMAWFGAQVQFDDTINKTPLKAFLQSAQYEQLQASMNLTIYTEVIRSALSVPNVYDVTKWYNTERRAPAMMPRQAVMEQINLLQQLPGILQRTGPDHGMAVLVQLGRKILQYTRSEQHLQPTFLMMPRDIESWYEMKTSAKKSEMSEAVVNKIFEAYQVDKEVQMMFPPVVLPSLHNLSVLMVDLVDLEDGLTNVMENHRTFGQYALVNPNLDGGCTEFQMMDHESRCWTTVFKLDQLTGPDSQQVVGNIPQAVNSVGTVYHIDQDDGHVSTHPLPDQHCVYAGGRLPWIIVFRPNMRFTTQTVVMGIGGAVTGMTFIGQVNEDRYHSGDLRRTIFMKNFRMGVAVFRREHILLFEDAIFSGMNGGQSCKLWESADEVQHLNAIVEEETLQAGGNLLYSTINLKVAQDIEPGVVYAGAYNETVRSARSCGDVFMYAIPGHVRGATDGLNSARYAKKIDELQRAPCLMSGGKFKCAGARELETDGRFNWILDELHQFVRGELQTALQSLDPISSLADHGRGININELCFRAPGRFRPRMPFTSGAVVQPPWEYTSAAPGPLEPSSLDSGDTWNGQPKLNPPRDTTMSRMQV